MVSENYSESDVDILLRLQDAYREIDWLKVENNRLRLLLAEPDDMCNSLPYSKEELESEE